MFKSKFAQPDNNQFRAKRFTHVKQIIQEILVEKGTCTILDVGGTAAYWTTYGQDLDLQKIKVTLMNNDWWGRSEEPGFEYITGDARSLSFPDGGFDFVHSNSVIEHVGRWGDMQAMANEIRRAGRRYYVQTPYYWFPIEPHFRLPFFHWLPESLRYRIVMTRDCGYVLKQPDVASAMKEVEHAVLLDKMQMKALFPDAQIINERIYGVTKSIMAVR